MHNCKLSVFLSFCLLFLCGVYTHSIAQETTIVLGGKSGWPKLETESSVVSGNGRFGFECKELATNIRPIDEDTDLYIDFEDGIIQDKIGNYIIEDNSVVLSSDSVMGKSCGLIRRDTEGFSITGSDSSLFGSSGNTGSFLIEFWLCPSIAENGEVVFSWRSSRTVAGYPLYQIIKAGFVNNHFEWQFTNVFNGYTENNGELIISSNSTIIPNVWSHHVIVYDEHTGMLEYRINGYLEGLKYVTSNQREIGGSVYSAILGVTAALEICPQYTGFIDDLRVERNCINQIAEEMRYDTYKTEGGRFVTEPIMVSQGSVLNKIDAITSIPDQTAIVMFVRSGDDYFNWTDNYPEWKPIQIGTDIEEIEGLYFQVAVNLYPDGGGKTTPSVTELTLHFTELPLPLPPYSLSAVPGDGEVTLHWNFSVDDIAGGYYVFYGERPGEYLGREAFEGPSPIDVDNVVNVKITGLKNGKIYYFAVSSYSKYSKNITGELSKEVYARPLKK